MNKGNTILLFVTVKICYDDAIFVRTHIYKKETIWKQK